MSLALTERIFNNFQENVTTGKNLKPPDPLSEPILNNFQENGASGKTLKLPNPVYLKENRGSGGLRQFLDTMYV